jgi:tRNA (cmo5U34)-methyltransferase
MNAIQEGTQPSSLGHVPTGRWAFDESVTEVFSDMLTRSIPQYEVMRKAVFELGLKYTLPGTCIVDLGCSRGDALAPFVSALGGRNQYLGVDVSGPMLAAARQRFQQEMAAGLVNISELDLRQEYPRARASLTLCILSLQFTPIDHRQRVLQDAFEQIVEGGAFILVEKVLGGTASLNARMVELYHESKREAGYSTEEIERKKLALEGVLVPITAQWNEQLLRNAGFKEVDCFWRWMNFAGWVAVK